MSRTWLCRAIGWLASALVMLLLVTSPARTAPAPGAGAPAREGWPAEPSAPIPAITFIDSPSATCYRAAPNTGDCYIVWNHLSVAASTSQYIISMTVSVDNVLRANHAGFFQTSMYLPSDIYGPGLRVVCGQAGAGGNPSLGAAHSYTLRARESGGLTAANYGTVYCPPDVVRPFAGLVRWVAEYATGAGNWTSQDAFPRTVADVTGDGKVDVVGFGGAGVYVSPSTSTHFPAPTLWRAAFGSTPAGGSWTSQNLFPRMVADINGDNRGDVVGFGGAGTYVALSTGTAFGPMVRWSTSFGSLPAAGGWSSQDANPRMLADVNYDNRADIVGFGGLGVYVALATGSGFGPMTRWSTSFGSLPAGGSWTSQNVYPRLVGDINGDGRADVVGFGAAGVFVALSTGTGFGPMVKWSSTFGASPAAGSWANQNVTPRTLADVDGDKKVDIVGFGGAGTYFSYSLGDHLGPITLGIGEFGLFPTAGNWTSYNTFPRMAGDADGDGKADLVGFGGLGVYVAKRNGP